MGQNLGFFVGECHRIYPAGADGVDVSACWHDLYIPAYIFAGLLLLSYLLLRFCVRDPH